MKVETKDYNEKKKTIKHLNLRYLQRNAILLRQEKKLLIKKASDMI